MATMAAFPRTLTIDDILSLRRLQAVQVSPDCANVAYLVEEPNDELHSKDPILSTLWIAPATPATQTASRLLAKGVIQSPQWAPHSSSIGYLMDGQIHEVSIAGGLPRQVTRHKTGISSFSWAPDGRRLALAAAFEEANPERQRHVELGYDALDLEPSDSVARRRPNRLWIVDVKFGRSYMIQ